MIYSLILPLYFLTAPLDLTAPLTLDDGHKIEAPLLKLGQVAPSSGFLISIGDIADIQSTLTGNSCLIRVAEIKDRFKKEVNQVVSRCDLRLKTLKDDLDDSKLLNQQLKQELKDEKAFSQKMIIGASIGGAILTTSLIYLIKG